VQVLLGLLTFGLVCLTWVFFRAQDFATAFRFLAVMFTPSLSLDLVPRAEAVSVLTTVLALLVGHWLLRNASLEEGVQRMPWWLRTAWIAGMLVLLALTPGDDRAFIYFQF
jgi:hypothetical protein